MDKPLGTLITAKDACKILQISRNMLSKLLREHKISCYRLGRNCMRFSMKQIEDYFASSGK